MFHSAFTQHLSGIVSIVACLCLASCGRDEGNKQASPSSVSAGSIPAKLDESPSLSGENALFHANKIVAIGDRSPGSPGAEKQRTYLKEELKKCGWFVAEQAFEADTPKGTWNLVNLRARFGKEPGKESAPGIISCHIDTKTGIPGFVGANDGASGAALILELARILKNKPELAQEIELVFFDGEESAGLHLTEEDGLYGSSYYADNMPAPLPGWLINLDMVGRQGMKIRIPADTDQRMYELYNKAITALNLNSSAWGVSTGIIMDDHVPFMRKGISCLNIIDDFRDGAWWHTAHDSIEILDADSFFQSGKMTLFLIEQLSKK